MDISVGNFAEKAQFCSFDILGCFFSKNLMFFEEPLLASLLSIVHQSHRSITPSAGTSTVSVNFVIYAVPIIISYNSVMVG